MHHIMGKKKVEQIRNTTIQHVSLSLLQAGVIGEYFIPFIYYPKIKSTICLAQ